MEDQNLPSQIPAEEPVSPAPSAHQFPVQIKKWEVFAGMAALFAIGGLLFFFGDISKFGSLPRREYSQTFTLVADKISQSAAVVVSLPVGIDFGAGEAGKRIAFEPPLEGEWLAGAEERALIFRPRSKMEMGKYYTVTLAEGEAKLQKDFYVDEDPKVVSVFPHDGSEAPERSDITIIFNRPMVPLTTLDALMEKDVPVEIMPTTPGKFKWITTRNLQFIPDGRLFRSTRYTVNIKEGLVSMDGLAIPGFSHKFTTRPLRYEGPELHHQGFTLYNEPVRIRFNQPVDIEKTRSFISVARQNNNANIPLTVEYGRRQVYDKDSGDTKEYIDKSVLEVYGAEDKHGRKKFWDFSSDYLIKISRAFPAEGDIELAEERNAVLQVPEIIAGLSADSPRSQHVSPDMFDPEGRLWANFYEDIEKDSSVIKADNLRDIGYGEKCRIDEDGNEIRAGNTCEKEPDKKKIYLKFSPDGLKKFQEIKVEFRKIFNTSGLQLNAESLTRTVKIFPELRITRTVPAEGGRGAKLTELKICSTSPLKPADEDDFYTRVRSNIPFGKWNWYAPFRVAPENRNSPCATGEFENTIRYGLIPESFYNITLKVRDDFGQETGKSLAFTSGKIDGMYRRFSHLQKIYNVTSPERTKLTYAVENLEYVNLHVCQVSAEGMLRYLESDVRRSSATPGEDMECVKTFSRRLELPKKYWVKNYFQTDIKDIVGNLPGHYILSFGHPDYRQESYDYRTQRYVPGERIYERTFLTVTNLAVQEKMITRDGYDQFADTTQGVLNRSGGNLYWVTDMGSMDPVVGARVDVYYGHDNGFGTHASGLTDASGVARTPAIFNQRAAIVTNGIDSAIVSDEFDKFQWASSAHSAERTYIYTDRPIYRPGQEVFIKGLYRIGYDGDYEVYREKPAVIKVFNSRGEKILEENAAISEYGTFNTGLRLDLKAPLGTYRIEALGGYAYMDVEEYVPAPFKVEVASEKEEYIAGDNMSLQVDANYYFGVPVEGGEAEYSIMAQDYYFDRYEDGYFQFGSGWYYSYEAQYGDKFVLRGKVTLDGSGKAKIERSIDFGKFFAEEERDRSKIFVVNITVRNSSGQAVSQQKSFIVHRGEFYLGVNLNERYFPKNSLNRILLKSVDTEGKEISVRDIKVEINKIKWESFKRQEVDGRFYWRTEKKKEVVRQFSARTDASGNYSGDISLDKEGEYEVSARSIDSRGNQIVSVMDFYVYGSGQVEVRPTNNEALDMAVDKNTVSVGDEVPVIIKSPFARARALVTVERGKIFEYHIIDVDQSLKDFRLKIKEEYIPNVYLSVVLISPRPEVKYGQIRFSVNTREKEIDISVRSDKNHYLPGENVKLEIEARDSRRSPVQAEVSVAVADLSVLALKGNPKKNPVAFFYAGLPLTVVTASNIKNILYEAEIPLGTKGGGGLEPGDLAKKKRGEFKDTAFWRGVVHTGTDGRAEVSFTLPDNLTTWQTEVVGITRDTKTGTGYKEFTARKELMVVPLKPRFIIPGDEFMLGAKIFNETGSTQKLEVSVVSPTLELKDKTLRSVRIDAGGTETVYFAAGAPAFIQDGAHAFTVSAKNSTYEDTVENIIPIRRNDTYEAVSTAHFTSENSSREYVFLPGNIVKDKGGVEIKTSATLAVFLLDALNYLVGYPYGCSEQIASKLSSIAIVKRGLDLKNVGDKFTLKNVEFEGQSYSLDDVVDIGLARMYANQSYGGGFSYYPGLEPSFYLTLHVVNSLEDLRRAGYEVNQAVLDRAAKYLYNSIISDARLNRNKDLVILTAYAIGRLPGYRAENGRLSGMISEIANDEKFIHEDISNVSLAYLAIILTQGHPQSVKDRVFDVLENRITVDGRGASLSGSQGHWMWEYYETPIKDTALLLKALAADRRQNQLTDKILRWILRSRSKDGAWGSSNNTVSVVDAFTDFLEWRRETESDFSLTLSLDGIKKADFDFNSDTILNTFTAFLPTSDLSLDSMHALDFMKTGRNKLANAFYYDMLLKYFLPIDSVPPRDEGMTITREFYRVDDEKNSTPLTEASVGDVLKGHLTIVLPKDRNFVSVEDFIPAGMEIVNLKLATEDQSLRRLKPENPYFNDYFDGSRGAVDSPDDMAQDGRGIFGVMQARIGVAFKNFAAFLSFGNLAGITELPDDEYSPKAVTRAFYADMEESYDDRLFLFKERMPAGVYEFDYFVRALIPGKYHHLPAIASEMYFPENFGRTRGEYFFIKQ